MADLSKMIAHHINARSELERVIRLEDWKLGDQMAVHAAAQAVDDAVVALCAARPQTESDRQLRQEYLHEINLPVTVEGCRRLTERVIAALLAEGGAHG